MEAAEGLKAKEDQALAQVLEGLRGAERGVGVLAGQNSRRDWETWAAESAAHVR